MLILRRLAAGFLPGLNTDLTLTPPAAHIESGARYKQQPFAF